MTQTSEGPESTTGGEGASRFRNWEAILDLTPGGGPPGLRVGGEYRLGMRSGGKKLEKKVPDDFNPAFLALNVVDAPGDGGEWISVTGEFEAEAGQYSHVILRDDRGEEHEVEVQEVH